MNQKYYKAGYQAASEYHEVHRQNTQNEHIGTIIKHEVHTLVQYHVKNWSTSDQPEQYLPPEEIENFLAGATQYLIDHNLTITQ